MDGSRPGESCCQPRMANTDPKMHAIVVGHWADDGWRPNARLLIRAIARRWGVPVIELTRASDGDDCGMHQELWLDLHCEAFDRVAWFDRDTNVCHDCPNLFDIVEKGSFGCISTYQSSRHSDDRAQSTSARIEANGTSCDHEIDQLTKGVMVFDPRACRYLQGSAKHLPSLRKASLPRQHASVVGDQAVWPKEIARLVIKSLRPRELG